MKKIELPCQFAHNFSDWVPMPFGSGNCSMPGFECLYDGDIEIDEDAVCNENATCPAYKPVDTFICKKHVPNTRYFDYCPTCMDKEEKARAEKEASEIYWAEQRRQRGKV